MLQLLEKNNTKSALETAMDARAYGMAEMLIRNGAPEEIGRESGNPHACPLMLKAVFAGRTEIVAAMLEMGWRPDVRRIQDYLTPLMAASAKGSFFVRDESAVFARNVQESSDNSLIESYVNFECGRIRHVLARH